MDCGSKPLPTVVRLATVYFIRTFSLSRLTVNDRRLLCKRWVDIDGRLRTRQLQHVATQPNRTQVLRCRSGNCQPAQ